jgi:hypothetical protein
MWGGSPKRLGVSFVRKQEFILQSNFVVLVGHSIKKLIAAAATDEVLVGSEVRNHHPDVQLITDATTGYGKTIMNVTLGFARVNGSMKIDDDHPTKASIDLEIYRVTFILPNLL